LRLTVITDTDLPLKAYPERSDPLSKELRFIHLSNGLVVAILGADVIKLARAGIIHDDSDDNNLCIEHINPISASAVEILVTSVVKAGQVTAAKADELISRKTSGGGGGIGIDWGVEAGKISEKIATAKAFRTDGFVDDGVAHGGRRLVGEGAGEEVMSPRTYTKTLVKEAIRGGLADTDKISAEVVSSLESIEAASASKVTNEEFRQIRREVATELSMERLNNAVNKAVKQIFGI
jgi:hypothetical protein